MLDEPALMLVIASIHGQGHLPTYISKLEKKHIWPFWNSAAFSNWKDGRLFLKVERASWQQNQRANQ